MLTEFLPSLGVDFRMYVVEQSTDGRKFNRGALLNVGSLLATQDGFTTIAFHDVDLLPVHASLRAAYAGGADAGPVHLASMWDKYTYAGYLGGVLMMHVAHVRAANGFPNTGFGWGGEDDALARRIQDAKVPAPKKFRRVSGAYEDLEDTYPGLRACTKLEDGGDVTMRNMTRREMLESDPATWTSNGLNSITWSQEKVVAKDPLLTHVVVALDA
jgi:hypothetical protein